MGIEEMIKGKREWRAHMARVKALPNEYRIVYEEMQKYYFKVGPVELTDEKGLLSDIVDLFEQGAAHGKGVLEVTGKDVASFADGLIEGSRTYSEDFQESVAREVEKEAKKELEKEANKNANKRK